jgi:Uma2 family endonuclease
MPPTVTSESLMTAAEFQVAEGLPAFCELVKGKVVEMNRPSKSHGEICSEINYLLKTHCKQHACGTVFGNDSGILVGKNPDTVRGADVAYCSYDRIPKGKMPDDYSGPAPEVVIEVLSKTDRWSNMLVKIGEYLGIDVLVVCIIDPEQRTARLFRGNGTDVTLTEDEVLEIPEIQPTFQVKVSELFA